MLEKLFCFLFPPYAVLVRRIRVLERENKFLVDTALSALVTAEKCSGRAMRSTALSQVTSRWPGSRKLMYSHLGQLAGALKKHRQKCRNMIKAFCHKYDKPVPEFRDD
ncbi:hypothetical protein pEaSNUABM6_00145 [Erwinia phage pEa_SNUABM_6]|nr:hypothetical protein pEaSNUABM6_00145 [Erwinia phage pEa_SNUABM_6]